MKRVKPVCKISDENLMKHLEIRHPGDMKMEFTVEPGRTERRIRNRTAWETYHDTMHRISTGQYDHYHDERSD